MITPARSWKPHCKALTWWCSTLLAALLCLTNENDNHVATKLMRRLGKVLASTGCAGILLHHTPKLTKEAAAKQRGEMTLVRGGSAIVASVRVAWTLTGISIEEGAMFAVTGQQADAIRRLDPVKLNDMPPPDPTFLEVFGVSVTIADGSQTSVRAICFTGPPQMSSATVSTAQLNAVMHAIDNGTTLHDTPHVPLSPAKNAKHRRADHHIGRALQAADPSLSDGQPARALARCWTISWDWVA